MRVFDSFTADIANSYMNTLRETIEEHDDDDDDDDDDDISSTKSICKGGSDWCVVVVIVVVARVPLQWIPIWLSFMENGSLMLWHRDLNMNIIPRIWHSFH